MNQGPPRAWHFCATTRVRRDTLNTGLETSVPVVIWAGAFPSLRRPHPRSVYPGSRVGRCALSKGHFATSLRLARTHPTSTETGGPATRRRKGAQTPNGSGITAMQEGGSMRQRLRELAQQIATEQDHDRFATLVKEFNQLLDGEQQAKEPRKPNPDA